MYRKSDNLYTFIFICIKKAGTNADPTQTSYPIFDTSKQNISYHISNVLKDGELSSDSTVKEILTVQKEGEREVNRTVQFYNLDMVIAVGYRVNSYNATQFRVWARFIG